MSASADYAARLDAVTNAIAADLREAQAKGDAEWSAALDGPISRLEAMGQNTDDPAADSDGTVPDAGSDSDEPTA